MEGPQEITEPQEISVPEDILTKEWKDDESATEHEEVFEDNCDDSDDPNGSLVAENFDNLGEELQDSKLGMYEDLEVINCHNKHESCTPMLKLSESVKLLFHCLHYAVLINTLFLCKIETSIPNLCLDLWMHLMTLPTAPVTISTQ